MKAWEDGSMIVVHVTHEAVEKIGGIGAVVAGLVTADSYEESVSRTILLGPMMNSDGPPSRRLGDGGRVIYSSLDGIYSEPWREMFLPIERTHDVGIVYGTRKVNHACTGKSVDVEVLVIDVFHVNQVRLDLFKLELYRKFAIPSDRFEHIWEYEEYVRLAEPGFEALKAIGCDGDEPVVILAHEHMGIPTALKAILDGAPNVRTVFYAHEVASVRPIVEDNPGHDTMFYNVMDSMSKDGQTVEKIFPEVFDSYKHPLVKAARYCDHVFAVGDYVRKELQFLDRHFRTMDIDLMYNGIPAELLTLEEKQLSARRMRQYADNLFGYSPTWIFTHVCRPVRSKALWRDLRVLHEMEPLLALRGERAVYFLLATMAGQRRPQDIRQMERVYGWPVAHEDGYPDLCQGEEHLGDMIDAFNLDRQNVRAVFVNQWDWNYQMCGQRFPRDMTFPDIRRGTDVEFGLSIYEPFGISQLEPLSFGAICVPSNVCGCVGFAQRAGKKHPVDENIVEGNFLNIEGDLSTDELLNLSIERRDQVESREGRRLAELIIQRLPRDDETLQRLVTTGYALAREMSWEHVVNEYFLPSLGRAAAIA